MGVLLGTQKGHEVEIVNSFELAADETKEGEDVIDQHFLASRTLQCQPTSFFVQHGADLKFQISKSFLRWSSLDGIPWLMN